MEMVQTMYGVNEEQLNPSRQRKFKVNRVNNDFDEVLSSMEEEKQPS